MSISFERPVGAAADLSELEYVSALHQTQPGLVRTDGSVRDIDIVHFLLSRYGIKVDVETVRKTVLVGLGGDFDGGEHEKDGDHGEDDVVKDEKDDDDDEEEEGIDLAELASILLIPTLLKSAARDHPAAHQLGPGSGVGGHHRRRNSVESVETGGGEGSGLLGGNDDDDGVGMDDGGKELLDSLLPVEGLIAKVLGTMLRDVTGSSSSTPDRPPALTAALMRDILVAYGEEHLARDEGLLEAMVKAAASSPPEQFEGGKKEEEVPLFDADALARGLTHDVLLYDTANEVRLSSNYQDVLTAGAGGAPTDAKTRQQLVGPPPAEIAADEGDDFREEDDVEKEAEVDPDSEERLKLTFGAPSLDFVADQYMSKNLAVLLWCGFVIFYLAHGIRLLRVNQISASLSEEKIIAAFASCQEEWESLQPNPIATSRYHACVDDYFQKVAYNPELYECQGGINGGPQIGCSIAKSVIRWVYILASLMSWGLLSIGVGSIGNSVRAKRRWPMVFGLIYIGGAQGWFYYSDFLAKKDNPSPVDIPYPVPYYNDDGELATQSATWPYYDDATSPANVALIHMSLFLACCIVAVQSTLLLGPCIRRWCCRSSAAAARFFTPGSIKVETGIKQAAARKVNVMVRNALELHRSEGGDQSVASFGQALVNFSLQEKTFERAGGIIWTWKSLYNDELFAVEGIWISARIWAGNIAQFFLTIVILITGIFTSQFIVQLWREGKEQDDLLLQVLNWLIGKQISTTTIALSAKASTEALLGAFLNFTGGMGCDDTISDTIGDLSAENVLSAAMNATDVCGVVHQAVSNSFYNASGAVHDAVYDFIGSLRLEALNELVNKFSDDLYPESEYMVALPLAVATAVAFLFAFALFVTYIPSVTSTILKLRCGVIPFFHDKRNQKDLRSGMYQVTMLIGAMFWGLLVSVALITFVVGLVVFLILWQATRTQVIGFIVQMVGLAITFTIRFLIIFFGLSGTVYAGYYRKRPTQGNFVSLLLEAANVAYTSLTAIVRAAKLIVICILYVGRLDTPLLAPGVGLGPIGDKYPAMFQRDILSHEAHRHPYIEVLGTMYMMKLRYRELFAEQAGYCFRLIFTIALMPWIRKYRILARPGSFGDGIKKNNEVLQAKKVPQSEIQGAGAEHEILRVEIERLRAEIAMLRTGTGTVNGGDEKSYTEMVA